MNMALPTSQFTRGFAVASALFVGAVSGCGANFDSQYDEMEMFSWPADGVQHMTVKTAVKGSVTVSGGPMAGITGALHRSCWGRSEFEASQFVDRVTIEDSMDDGALTLETTDLGAEERYAEGDLDLYLPADLELTVDVSDGDIALRDMEADLTVDAGGGIEMLNMAGSLAAVAAEGIALDMSTLGPDQLVELTAGGDVVLTVPQGSVFVFNVETPSGQVTLDGFDEVHYGLDEEGHKVGYVGEGYGGAVLIELFPANGTADVHIVAG
jgi:hypothetical protein